MTAIIQIAIFLIDTLFTLFMLSVLLRILLEAFHADFYNPLCQMILKTTNFLLLPVRKIVPPYKGIDWASGVLILVLAFFKQGILILLTTGEWGNPLGLLLLGFADVLDLLFYILLFAIIAVTVSNWLKPATVNPLIQIAAKITSPLFNLVRRFLPAYSGFDFSPLVLAGVLIVLNLLIIQLIGHLGVKLLISS